VVCDILILRHAHACLPTLLFCMFSACLPLLLLLLLLLH
jgi:hypothetical protein